MGKLTPEKYALTCALMKLGFDIHSGNEHLVFDAAKAYAAAQVAEAVDGWKLTREHLEKQVAAKDAESDSLTFQLSEANRVLEAHKVVAASRSENIAALKADNARMSAITEKQIANLKNLVWLARVGATIFKESEMLDEVEALMALLSPADGDGVEETSAGGNMENPSFLIGAKCDDGEPVSLHIHHGNNGDFYPEIRYKDKRDGNWRRSPSPRISTSGGHNGPEILIAISNLYRALAGRGIEG